MSENPQGGFMFLNHESRSIVLVRGPLSHSLYISSSSLAWRMPGTGEPGGPPSMGSHRVGHD